LAEQQKNASHEMPSLFRTDNPPAKYVDGGDHLLHGVVSGAEYRIAANVAGSVAGAGVTVEEAIARVFNVLLQKENAQHLTDAMQIAKAPKYMGKLRGYCMEALRFQPQAEMLPRVCVEATTVEGSAIPAGALVFAGLYTAMHDPIVGQGSQPPSDFLPGRDEKFYLHFGYERNKCVGYYIAPVEIVEALRCVLAKVNSIEMIEPMKFSKEAPFADKEKLNEDPPDNKGPYAFSLRVRVT
jgi:cytochrome P450